MELLTERLRIREFEEEDRADVHAYASDPETVQFLPFGPNSEEETRDFVRKAISERQADPRRVFELAITLRNDPRVIGAIRVFVENERHRQGHVGYILNRALWSTGYMTEAAAALLAFGFKDLGFHRIWTTCDTRNIGSMRVLEKIGMRREGLLLHHIQLRDGWRDSYLYAILEDEFSYNAGTVTERGR